jgi:putative phosphoribosyl transferase
MQSVKSRIPGDAHQPVGRTVSIRAGSVTLEGELAVSPGAIGIVLFVHGSGSSRYSPRNQFVAQAIRRTGTATLLFDLLTRQEEANGDRKLVFDIPLLAQRLVDTTDWIARQAQTHHLGVGYFGASTGAAAALVAAAQLGPDIDAVVSRGGRPDLAGDALSRVGVPTLLIVGGEDKMVLTWNRESFERLTCAKDLRVIAGATHLFEEEGALEEVAQLAAGWFHRHLRPR